MFSFLHRSADPCRQEAKEIIFVVFLGVIVYIFFQLRYLPKIEPFSPEQSSQYPSVIDAFMLQAYRDLLSSRLHASAVLKCVPALLAAIQVLRLKRKATCQVKSRQKAANTYTMLILIGICFCAGGDYWLAIDTFKGDRVVRQCLLDFHITISPFIIGLVSFLMGHIAFIFAFYYDGGNGTRLMQGVVLYGYSIALVYYIIKYGTIDEEDNVLKGGIAVYSLVIATMGHRAMSLSLDAYPGVESTSYASLGACCFVLSDSLLAYNRFIGPIPFGNVLVLLTYFLALALLASSSAGSTRWKVGWD